MNSKLLINNKNVYLRKKRISNYTSQIRYI